MRRLFRVTRDSTGNLPGLPAVFPDMMAPVVRAARDGERELSLMRWGFPPPPIGNAPVTNVRNPPYWRGWLKAEWRCLVPATSFCEWTDSRPKVTHWFALDESRPLFAFAGIWRFWTGERKGETGDHQLFAFLTTESNDVVRPIRQGHAGAFDDGGRVGNMACRLGRRSDGIAKTVAERCAADCRDRREKRSGAD